MPVEPRNWAVIPAAGFGTRMNSDLPKQYLTINGKTILEHTLGVFCTHSDIHGVVVAISKTDSIWPTLSVATHPKIMVTNGGQERCHSVMNCLQYLSTVAKEDDWVLVHDAARPCIAGGDVSHLIKMVGNHAVGGLLALPVRDTMKRSNQNNEVQETIDRNGLWHALTPQMFRLGNLTRALKAALDSGILVTDDAQALELQNQSPLLVEGKSSNIKITRKDDLAIAELYLDRGSNK